VTVPTVLVADAEPVVLSVLGRFLAAPGRTVLTAGSAAEARRLSEAQGPVDVALLDRDLGDGSGLELAAELKARRRETEVILVTAYASFETAVEALKVGLYDYLSKPIDDFEALRLKVDNALEKVRLQAERQQAEAEVRHIQKMDAIGRLAGGLGHDLANMMAVILGWSEDLAETAPGHMREGLQEIQGAAERATRLVRQMMTLARRGPADPMRLSLNHAIEDMARLLRRSLGPRVELVQSLQPDLAPILADPSQLGQVLLNLAVNARDAMPDGGRLTISTSAVETAPRAGGEGPPPGPGVALEVSDEGVGMAPEIRDRIFEPFFTTKPAGQGTGLGLAIVYGIVRQSGGSIQVESAPGRGTTFRLVFPVAAAEAAAPGAAASGPRAEARAGATVLLAESDAPLRALSARALRQAGFEVLEAPDGEQALHLAREHRRPLDALVTEDLMADLSGPGLVAAVRRAHPGCRALLVSGFPNAPEVVAFAGQGGAVLQKPFRMSALLEAVRLMLAAP
jgi:hypothetical protein